MLTLLNDCPLNFHTYADDIQLYIKCSDNPKIAPNIISSTIVKINSWLSANSLCMNPTKTEALHILINNKHHIPIEPPSIVFNNLSIPYSSHVRNLGVIFDKSLNFDKQILKVLRSFNHNLHSLRLIRKSINTETAQIIASAYILPQIDYCNFILDKLPYNHIKRLQIAQNSLTRCIFNIHRRSNAHITPYLMKLHWLPIIQRIKYKSLLLVHKVLHHNSPEYLTNLITLKLEQNNITRSSNNFTLNLPSKYQLHSTNIRAWSISSPYNWNTLPPNIRTTTSTPLFKKLLKTWLFQIAHE